MSERGHTMGDGGPNAFDDAYALDIVGVGALNLDYITNASAITGRDAGRRLSAAIAEILANVGISVESGTEAMVDEVTINAVLEKAAVVAYPTTVLGGSAFNTIQTMAQTKVGLRLGYVGVAGRLPVLGMSILRQLDTMGVDRRGVLVTEDQLCGICFSYAENGERTLLTHMGANSRMADHLDSSFDTIVTYLASARVIHVTSFHDNATADRLVPVLQTVKKQSPDTRISFDPGHIWSVTRTPEVDGIISLSDYVLLNYREFQELGGNAPGKADEDIAGDILSRFENEGGVVVVKRPNGILAFRRNPHADAPVPGAEPGATVVREFYPQLPLHQSDIEDATGAGDVFAAGLLTVLAHDPLQLELGSRLGMRLARHKLRHVGIQGTRFDEVTREFLASPDAQRGA